MGDAQHPKWERDGETIYSSTRCRIIWNFPWTLSSIHFQAAGPIYFIVEHRIRFECPVYGSIQHPMTLVAQVGMLHLVPRAILMTMLMKRARNCLPTQNTTS